MCVYTYLKKGKQGDLMKTESFQGSFLLGRGKKCNKFHSKANSAFLHCLQRIWGIIYTFSSNFHIDIN
uniref:Uncharacterized protein n=1 Tax=Rhizophora mucronata TaxID=61149 RepID=A0A2P2P7F6_RHIMU